MLRYLLLAFPLLLSACASKQPISLLEPGAPVGTAAQVIVPAEIHIKRIGKKKFPSLLTSGDSKTYLLAAGTHTVELRYEQLWELDADNHDIVKSDSIEMSWNLKPGHSYTLEFIPAKNYEAALELSKSFSPRLSSGIATAIPAQSAPAPDIAKTAEATPLPVPESAELSALKSWWSRSNREDRQEFLNWITNN